jgi:hypothetical protein
MRLEANSAHIYVDINAQSMAKVRIIILLPVLSVSLWHCGDGGEKRRKEAGG